MVAASTSGLERCTDQRAALGQRQTRRMHRAPDSTRIRACSRRDRRHRVRGSVAVPTTMLSHFYARND